MTARGGVEAESPLARLGSRKGSDGRTFLAREEVAAGERLRADFTRGGMTPSVTQRWEPATGGGGRGAGDLSDAAIDCRGHVSRALDAVGPELSGVLLDVCCFLKGLEAVEREHGWPARSAKLLLKAALGCLARHYGFVHAAPSREGRLRSWSAPGARPVRRNG